MMIMKFTGKHSKGVLDWFGAVCAWIAKGEWRGIWMFMPHRGQKSAATIAVKVYLVFK